MKNFLHNKRKSCFLAMFCGLMVIFTVLFPNVAGGGHNFTGSVVFDDRSMVNPIEKIEIKENRKFDNIIKRKAEQYSVSFIVMSKIIDCENRDRIADLQSFVKYTERQILLHPEWGEVGEREKSFGLVQIHLPSHPHISFDQATDPEFSIDFLAKNIQKGNAGWWSCYKKI